MGEPSPNRLRLSVVDVTFALFCLIPPLVFGHQMLNSDGDAARHIRMGQLLLREGFGAMDNFSFTAPGGPVVLTEWGSRVLYALVYGWAGLSGVALLGGVLIGAAAALVVLFLLRRGVDPLLAYLVGIVTAFGGQVHWLARPHLFSLVGLAALLFLLEPGERRRSVLWFAPLFAIWANLHGGHVLGLMLVGVYLAGCLAEAVFDAAHRAEWLGRARWYALGLAVACGATLLNPQGPMLLVHVARLLGYDYALATTFEFRSPDFHTFYGKQFLVLLGAVVAIITIVRPRPDLRRLGLVLLMMAGALVSRRNIALFGLLVPPIVAIHANAAWSALGSERLDRIRTTFRDGEALARPGLWLAPIVAFILVLCATNGAPAGVGLVPDRFDPDVFPVEAVEWARAEGITGRVFNQFTWGGYMVFAWPEQPIFIDGMTDYFGEDVLSDYVRISGVSAGWAEGLKKWDIDLVLMPPTADLPYTLKLANGWTTIYEDSTAALLRRADRAGNDR